MAALKNQFKKTMDDSEKIAIAIEKLLIQYQPVPAVEMRKEELMLMVQHIENATFNIGSQCMGLTHATQ